MLILGLRYTDEHVTCLVSFSGRSVFNTERQKTKKNQKSNIETSHYNVAFLITFVRLYVYNKSK